MSGRVVGAIGLAAALLWAGAAAAAEKPVVRLATTSALEQTGLLAYLLPKFTADTGVEVKVLAVDAHNITLKRTAHDNEGSLLRVEELRYPILIGISKPWKALAEHCRECLGSAIHSIWSGYGITSDELPGVWAIQIPGHNATCEPRTDRSLVVPSVQAEPEQAKNEEAAGSGDREPAHG